MCFIIYIYIIHLQYLLGTWTVQIGDLLLLRQQLDLLAAFAADHHDVEVMRVEALTEAVLTLGANISGDLRNPAVGTLELTELWNITHFE